jgi:predicted porin
MQAVWRLMPVKRAPVADRRIRPGSSAAQSVADVEIPPSVEDTSNREYTMKSLAKSLIAAAVAATALPAIAQSSVQIYGIADIGVAVTNFNDDTLTVVRENRTARYGLRGNEKLWDEMEVLWRLEGEVDMSTGQNPDGLFYRQAWLGLKTRYGLGRLGQTKDLFDDLSEYIDPFRNDGIFGDYSKRAWRVGLVRSRVSNSFTYEAPKVYGLKFAAQYSLDETVPGVGNPGWSVMGQYEYRDLMLLASYDRPTLTSAGPQGEAWVVGAAYQFGAFRVSASYNHGDLNNATATVPATELDAYTLGLTWNVGPGQAKAAYSRMNSNVGNVNASIRDLSTAGIGYDYYLSKRTTLYLIGMYEGEGQYNSTTRKFVTGTTTGLQAGITHLF